MLITGNSTGAWTRTRPAGKRKDPEALISLDILNPGAHLVTLCLLKPPLSNQIHILCTINLSTGAGSQTCWTPEMLLLATLQRSQETTQTRPQWPVC